MSILYSKQYYDSKKWLPTIIHFKALKQTVIFIIHFIEIRKLVFDSITAKLLNTSIVLKYKCIPYNAKTDDNISLIKVNGYTYKNNIYLSNIKKKWNLVLRSV